jgi:hypothetical protein
VNPPGARARRTGCGSQFISGPQRERELDPLHELLGDYLDAEELELAPSAIADLAEGELHGIAVLARALHRKPGTVRQWEHRGIIPPAAHFVAGNGKARTRRGAFGDGSGGQRRMYTSAETEAAAEIAASEACCWARARWWTSTPQCSPTR